MADYDTGKDIVEDMLSRAGELSLNAAELSEESKRYANRGYYTIVRQFPWLFAEGYPPLAIATTAMTKLTATVAPGSLTVQTDVAVPSELGYKIVVGDHEIPFRCIPDTTIASNYARLQVPWPFAAATNVPGYLYRDEYLTPDVLVASRIKNLSRPGIAVSIVGYEELDSIAPVSIPFGNITRASYYSEDYIRLAMVPETPEVLELHYSKRPKKLDFSGNPESDTPIVPIDERWMIADYGLYFLLKDHGDDRADSVAQIAAGRVAEIKDRQIAKMSPRVFLPSAFSIAVK